MTAPLVMGLEGRGEKPIQWWARGESGGGERKFSEKKPL
jgi:hypothetical protein